MDKVIVFGANGRTGRILIEMALARGLTVTAAVRKPAAFADFQAASPHADRLRVATVDVEDITSVRAAVSGHDAAVSAIGTGRKPNGLYSRGTRNIVTALEEAGIQRFICISSGAVKRDDPNLGIIYGKIISPLLMKELYDDVEAMEKIVHASSLDWVLVRPAFLPEKAGPRGTWRTLDESNPRGGWRISRYDLATFTLDQLESAEWVGRHPTIAW